MRTEDRRRPKAILIAGPTASGKSALAVRLANRLGGTVINADSMQVYRDLSILTARPRPAEMTDVPHALYGTVDGAHNHSVSRWLADARAEILRTSADGLLPIVVGGTGLYFKALTQGLSDIPSVPDAIRTEMRAWAAGLPAEALHVELTHRDPGMAAKLKPSDTQRILRALEVHEATGESLARFQAQKAPPVLEPSTTVALALAVDRDTLRSRIDLRFDTMIASGALDEVVALAGRSLDPALPVMRAIGLPPLLRHLAGDLTMAAAIEAGKLASRQYIKRQETFVRHQLPDFHPVAPAHAEDAAMAGADRP